MSNFVLSPQLFQAFSAILADHAGLNFDETKCATLQSHLRDRARVRHLPGLDEYLQLLGNPTDGPAEIQRLVETVTIHETSFFRNQEHFKALNTQVIPTLVAGPRSGPRLRTLRLWSAGCATGEEAYSLAIACLEHPALAGWKIQIVASDVSAAALERAREGVYSGEALRYVSPDRVQRWFTAVDNGNGAVGYDKPSVAATVRASGARLRPGTGPILDRNRSKRYYRVKDEVRRLITFTSYNLAHPPYDRTLLGTMDLLVCENVLIYFTAETVRQVIEEFYHCLTPGGYLFLGYSETLWRITKAFTMISSPATFFYQRPGPLPPPAYPVLPLGRATPPLPLPPVPLATLRVPPPAASTPPTPALPVVLVPNAEEQTAAAHALLEQGRYQEARQAFEAVLARQPSAVDALVGLAQIQANQDQPDAAMALCRRALALDALCEDAHLLLGLLNRQTRQWGAALDHFAKAIYINSESVAGHYHLAELHRAQANWTEAAREYRRTLWALDRTRTGDTISGLPVAMIRKGCEQQLGRLHDQVLNGGGPRPGDRQGRR